MQTNPWKILPALLGAVYLAMRLHLNASAQDITTPTPLTVTLTPPAPTYVLPPGDTTILVIGAILLVLIVFGAVAWTSRRAG